LALALTAGSFAIATTEAEASPMIFGIAAWKAVTIVATSLFIGGVIGASAARNHQWSGDNRGWDNNRCPVHISARDGHRYVRANCT